MFSSSPFPELPMSPNAFITPYLLIDEEKDCVCFNYYRNNTDPFTSDGWFFHSPPIMDNVSTNKQDFISQQPRFSGGPVLKSCEDHYDVVDAVTSCSMYTKKLVESKKDLLGEIYTSRIPRGTRRRLSVEISRKFFCLQDLHGFDKAGKTLDWLFTKSKKAIKELAEKTNNCSSSHVSYESNMKFLESIKGDSDEDKVKKNKLDVKCADDKKKKMTEKSVAGFQKNHARHQSRVMARARARERTREKMNSKMLNDKPKMLVTDKSDCQMEIRKRSRKSS